MTLKAYPPAWADHTARRDAARRWQQRGLLTPEQLAAIDAANPLEYYQPLLFLRIGLFVATWLGGLSVTGALAALTEFAGGVVGYCLLLLAGTLFVLEKLIRSGRHYHSGVDNALLYGALCAWGALVAYLVEQVSPFGHGSNWLLGQPLLWLLVLVLAVPALLRYADPVVAVVAFVTALLLLASALMQVRFGQLLLPFATMGAATGLHYWLRTLPARPDYFYYRSCIVVLRTLALATIYLASNYLVVRQGNAALLGWSAYQGPRPRFRWRRCFTFSRPGCRWCTSGWALRRHDRLLLALGCWRWPFRSTPCATTAPCCPRNSRYPGRPGTHRARPGGPALPAHPPPRLHRRRRRYPAPSLQPRIGDNGPNGPRTRRARRCRLPVWRRPFRWGWGHGRFLGWNDRDKRVLSKKNVIPSLPKNLACAVE